MAQLVARLVRNEKARGSNPLSSTPRTRLEPLPWNRCQGFEPCRLIWTLSAHTRYDLRRYLPTNRLLDAIRRRRNVKWGFPAMLLAVPYLLIASICTNALDQRAPGWLHLVVPRAVWNAMKFIIMGLVNLILLIRAPDSGSHRPAPRPAGHPRQLGVPGAYDRRGGPMIAATYTYAARLPPRRQSGSRPLAWRLPATSTLMSLADTAMSRRSLGADTTAR